MSLKQIQTVELPPAFEEDFFRLKAQSDDWIDDRVSASRQYDCGNMTPYRSLARSALNFDTVTTDLLSEYQVPITLSEEEESLQASVPRFIMPKVLKYDRQLKYFSRCATYDYPGIANQIGSIDILVSNRLPWYRQIMPDAGPETADRLLMTRILSECLESYPDAPERETPFRLELYEKRAQAGIKPLEIEEFRRLVGRAVAMSLSF